MAVHVGERFLDDAKNRKLQAFLDPAKVIGDFSVHRNLRTFGEKCGVGMQCGNQSSLLQHGRVQNGRDEADFANRFTGQGGGGLHQLVNLAIAARHGATDLSEGHFQGGQGLRRGFVKLAAHSPLLFVADGQQLVREPALIRLGLRSNVAGHSDEADNFAAGIGDRCGQALQYAQRTIGKGVGFGEAEGRTGTDGRFEVLAEPIDIFESQDWPDFREIGRELRRVEAMKLKELPGPEHAATLQVELPSTHAGSGLGMSQHHFGVAQTFGESLTEGDVLRGQDEIWSCLGGGPAAANV
jgi:hypothetical protein